MLKLPIQVRLLSRRYRASAVAGQALVVSPIVPTHTDVLPYTAARPFSHEPIGREEGRSSEAEGVCVEFARREEGEYWTSDDCD